ncbi:outer membrane beta-barrel protein [Hanstruepera flava]|uniref:outer membrane beta-barrel protein n=1 Tax=Hanstruepera flava TaxID=2930218 RepID=UPI0020286CDE|nr:outer membrane beta-barrel protein [Hanstruepera flava]
MKPICRLLIVSLCFAHFAHAQSKTDFGIKGGVNLTFYKVTEASFGDNPEVGVGYYGGLFVDIPIDNRLSFQPEVLFVGLNDFKFLNAPLYLKYEAADRFYLLIGPSMNYFFDFFSNKFKVRADLSVAYQISRVLDIHMKYSLGFEEITPNGLFLGLDWKL